MGIKFDRVNSLVKLNREERFFLIILFLALTGLSLIAGTVWYFQVVGITVFARFFLTVLLSILSLILLIWIIGFGSVLLTLIFEKPISGLIFFSKLTVEYLFPLTLYFGRLLGFSREYLQRAFIRVSNHLVRIKGIKVSGQDILILLPHCIQDSQCKFKITNSVLNCRRCGRCPIDRLLDLQAKYGCHLAVATGGTLARKVVKELKPAAIVAVACERDLTSGIQDIYPLPVMGVLNIRPEGPCINTLVDDSEVEAAILKFLRRDL